MSSRVLARVAPTYPKKLMTEAEVIPIRPRPAPVPSSLTVREEMEPAWIDASIEKIFELLELPDNWDSYGATKISSDAAAAMIQLLTEVMNSRSPSPTLVPSPEGHLQAEWHMNGIDLEAEVVAANSVLVFYRDSAGSWEKNLTSDLTLLVQAIDQLSSAR